MTTSGRVLSVVGASLLLLSSFSCATPHGIVTNPVASGNKYRSAYLVAHNGKSSDVDASIQREFFRRGFSVTSGPEGKQPETADLIVKYADTWNWDMAVSHIGTMYLRELDIQIYEAKTGTLLDSAGWKNSPTHGPRGLDVVVSDLVSGMLKKLGIGSSA